MLDAGVTAAAAAATAGGGVALGKTGMELNENWRIGGQLREKPW